MKGLSVALIGAGFMAIGAVSAAPAEAAQVSLDTCKNNNLNCTQVDYSGTVTVESPLMSLLEDSLPDLPGIVFDGNQAIATVEQSIKFGNFSGRLCDAGDCNLTIPRSYAQDYSDQIVPGFFSGLSQVFFLSSIDIKGQVLDTQNSLLSDFYISYNPDVKEVIIDGYDFNRIQPCLDGECLIKGTGFVNTNTDIPLAFLFPDLGLQGSSVVTHVSFNVTQTATPLSFTEPTSVPSAPEPSFLLASLLAGGGLVTAKRKQKK
ncbi:hypothetical protein [Coleofasciculus sp. E1-EBD-02]|uniref:hypothetical protein n=1 Tax=Coleofasciculus sp. E1-EBD-02 TaxID=3068481 RepID=UPI0032F80579